jgi:hypothetical protein
MEKSKLIKKKTKKVVKKVTDKVAKSLKKGFENIGTPIAKRNGII